MTINWNEPIEWMDGTPCEVYKKEHDVYYIQPSLEFKSVSFGAVWSGKGDYSKDWAGYTNGYNPNLPYVRNRENTEPDLSNIGLIS